MYLSEEKIKSLLEAGELKISPISEECFKPVSYTFKSGNDVSIKPGEFVVIESLETIELPSNIAGILSTRGSVAKLGLDCLLSDTIIEPGSTGRLIFCTVNHSKETIIINKGTPIVKCLFTKI